MQGGVVWQSGGRYLGCWQELSEQAVGDILKKEAFLKVSRAGLRDTREREKQGNQRRKW